MLVLPRELPDWRGSPCKDQVYSTYPGVYGSTRHGGFLNANGKSNSGAPILPVGKTDTLAPAVFFRLAALEI